MTRKGSPTRNKPKKSKKKPIYITLSILIILAISTVVYSTYQFEHARKQSLKLIEGNNNQHEFEAIEFNASKDEFKELIRVLLLGVDKEEDGAARSDTIMVAQYQPRQGKIKLISIMRDTYVTIPGYRNNKINTAFFLGGPELLRKTIKDNFDIDIHYYAMIDFDGFQRVVDIISPDGIEIDIKRRMYYSKGRDHIDFQPGLQRLDGQQALNYVRFRSDHENDFGRVRRQQEVLTILKDELLTFSGITRLPKLLGSIEPYIQTNIQNKQILDYGTNFFLKPIEKVETITIPVKGSFVDARYNHAGAVLEVDIEKNKQVIKEFLELDQEFAYD
ncbi:transcriptional regulator [Anaerobacillus alkalidiazotrophicus]|uniref:Regulatory protein MsrR n=1 Tax=Anaerobacillus alkalidiazotrophicus TaxID=472963 RepID=A0A1S2M5R2_9BACI|nr:LCP family protein [Anaerobacillus alkalidiazotrophicus]OIJ18485.1 transcriptional regulator [Anaerobacillus alkalidiazotrophicus]OIJ19964.1 transcriptional regulator [Anaerobacillus alkalidiazotrophicus]